MKLKDVESILIVKTSSLGDIVCSLPVLYQLKELYPQARIGWVVDHRFPDVLRGHSMIDRIYVYRRTSVRQGRLRALGPFWRELKRLRAELRADGWQIALDLQSLAKTAAILLASGAKVRIAEVGRLRHAADWLVANVRVRPRRRHAIERYLEVAGPLGCTPDRVRFELHVGDEELRWARERIAGLPRPLVAVVPGTAREEKRWPVEHFGEAVRKVAQQSEASFVVVGTAGERGAGEYICRAAGEERAMNLAGETNLRQLAAVLSLCDAMLTGDTGPMHMMAALGKPVVAIFGPTDPAAHGPWGEQHKVLRAASGRVADVSAEEAAQALIELLEQ